MDDIIKDYTHQVEGVFYLIENQGLTAEERNQKVCVILDRMRKEAVRMSRNSTLKKCEQAIGNLRDKL